MAAYCHCGTPAVWKIPNGPYLCMACWDIYQKRLQENQRLSFSFLNFLQDEMAFMAGLPRMGPRIQIPQPTYIKSAPVTVNTTNNIRAEAGSQVGQINAGALVYLNRAVTTFNEAGGTAFATALQTFTQQVVDSQQLSQESQRQILDLLKCLVEELARGKEKRNLSIFKLALQNIGPLLTVAEGLSAHWEKLKGYFESVFS